MFALHIKKLAVAAAMILVPFAVSARTTFEQASALLQAARSGDENAVRTMVQSGVNVNYRDPSGMSLACTAIMNNDLRTAQILQRYGADASRCDEEIRAYRRNNEETGDVGLFSGLNSTQSTLLVAGAAGLGVGALAYLAGMYSSSNNNPSSGNGNGRPEPGTPPPPTETINIPSAPINNGNAGSFAAAAPNFNFMSTSALATPLNLTYNRYIPVQAANLFSPNAPYRTNYLLLNSAYDAMGRGYLGQATLRNSANGIVVPDALSIGGVPASGGQPINVAIISGKGVTRGGTIQDSAATWSTSGTTTATANNTLTTTGGTGASTPDIVWLSCTASSNGVCTGWSANAADKFANIALNYNSSDIITSVVENANLNLQSPGSSVFNTTLIQSNFDGAFGVGAASILEYNKYTMMSNQTTAGVQTLFTNAYADTTTAAFEYLKYSGTANYNTFLVYYAQNIANGNVQYTNCGISFAGLNASCAISTTLSNLTDEVVATANFEWQKYNGSATLDKFTGFYTEMFFSTMGSISIGAGNLPDLITGQPIAMTGIAAAGGQLSSAQAILYRTYKGTASFFDFLSYYIYSTDGNIPPAASSCTPGSASCTGVNATALANANAAWAQYTLQQAELFDDTFLAKIVGGNLTTGSDFSGYLPSGQMTIIKTGNGKDINGRPVDFMNFQAMNTALQNAGTMNISIIANANAPEFTKRAATDTADAWAVLTPANQPTFINLINQYYQATLDDFLDAGLTADDFATYQSTGYIAPGAFAGAVFSGKMLVAGTTSNAPTAMFVFGAGDYYRSESPNTTLTATFENLAPKLYTNLEHLFMTSVAVMGSNGTYNLNIDQSNPSAINANNKIVLSQYVDEHGDVLNARACGWAAGRGAGGIDPWCFAAPGITSDQSVASLAGSVGVVNGAFNYMTMQQLFTLLAVTSDRLALTAAQLQSKYALPADYQARVTAGEDYKSVFAEVFGYGLTNLNNATTPGSRVFVFQKSGLVDKVISSNGNAEWQRYAASVGAGMISGTSILPSSAFGNKFSGISAPMFDIVESIDGDVSMPRIFTQSLDFQNTRSSLDLMDNFRNFGNEELTTAYDANGIKLGFRNDYDEAAGESYMREFDFKFSGEKSFANANYKARRTDGFGIMGLASDNVSTDAGLKSGRFRLGVGGFTGAIKVADIARDMDAANPELGKIYGYNAVAGFEDEKFALGFAAGQAIESNSILGAYGSGLLEMGGSRSEFVRANAGYNLGDAVKLSASAEIARTTPNNSSNLIMSEVSGFTSTAMSAGLDIGNISLGAALPLAVIDGRVKYLNVDMDYIDAAHGYDLVVNSTDREINMASREREVRFNAAYKMDLGIFTTANAGVIYRINPDNSSAFGNESILMFKLKHRLGI
ncbi:MAG: hypothetical protein LBG89_01305 [Rickettsiales bacterium]|jgi:hypothetical protein|nr:hypothetical protein [Rickettsiales bacterium]